MQCVADEVLVLCWRVFQAVVAVLPSLKLPPQEHAMPLDHCCHGPASERASQSTVSL